jgi:hypothetical protein
MRASWERDDGARWDNPVSRAFFCLEDMDTLTVFGAASVGAMLLFYSLEERSPWAILGFALACWSSAIYGWLAGVWPFTIIEGIWGIVALRRFARRR